MTAAIRGPELSIVEMVVVLASVAVVLARWTPLPARRAVVAVTAAVLVPGVVALSVTGLRWHLGPVLLAAGGTLPFAVAQVRPRPADRTPWRARWWLAAPVTAVCLGLVSAGPVTAWALPVPRFPAPTGPHPVGTTVFEWTDPQRADEVTGERRLVVAQLWYPAERVAAGARRAPYLGRTEREARTVADALAGYLGAPGFVLDGLPRARSRAVFDAPVAAAGERYPVVLFSPGLGGVRTQNTAWAEELASRGYVVAGLDHPYDSAAVVLADGRTLRTRITATGDPAADEKLAAGWTAVRAADLSFVLGRLAELDAGPAGPADPARQFAGRLDTGRAAVTGHSLGGGAALQAAHQDPRFAAVIDLDGFPRDPDPQPFHQPALAVAHPAADRADRDYLTRLDHVLGLSTASAYRLTVPGTAHLTFTDAPLYMPPVPALVGSRGRVAAVRTTAGICAEFLDATLRQPVAAGGLAAALARHGDLHLPGEG